MILGLGALVANSVCPYLIQEVFTNPATKAVNFKGLFQVPMLAATAAAVALALFFRPPVKTQPSASGVSAPAH
jgi:hypothetical protein